MTAIVGALLLTVVALGVNAWLVSNDRALEILTPAPEQVVRGLVGALSAHRHASAATHLSDELRADAEAPLAALDEELRSRSGDYQLHDAIASGDGDTAEVRAELRTSRGETFSHSFRLARDPDTRLWKVTALTR
jgi:hypothetical protein